MVQLGLSWIPYCMDHAICCFAKGACWDPDRDQYVISREDQNINCQVSKPWDNSLYGPRYQKRGQEYYLCESAYQSLSPKEQAEFDLQECTFETVLASYEWKEAGSRKEGTIAHMWEHACSKCEELTQVKDSARLCYQRDLPRWGGKNIVLWNALGRVGGGEVDGQKYSKEECFQQAVKIKAEGDKV